METRNVVRHPSASPLLPAPPPQQKGSPWRTERDMYVLNEFGKQQREVMTPGVCWAVSSALCTGTFFCSLLMDGGSLRDLPGVAHLE